MKIMRVVFVLMLCFSGAVSAEVTVTDDTGREVRLAQPAVRIISLAPHVTEMLFAIGAGDRVVGVVSFSDYPAAAKTLPQVGGYNRLDMEAIVALEPDLIVGWDSGNNKRELERLEQLGFTLYRSEPRTLAAVAATMERLFRIAESDAHGAEAIRRYRDRLEAIKAERDMRRKTLRVFYQVWEQPLMTINSEHIIDDVIRLCGGVNVFAQLTPLVPHISEEAVLAANPDVILAGGMGTANRAWLERWSKWRKVTAVKRNNLYFINPDLIQRAGPRIIEGAQQVCDRLAQAAKKSP